MGRKEHDRYTTYILPKQEMGFSFTEKIEQLTDVSGEKHSLFNIRFNCLKDDAYDYVTFASHFNKPLKSYCPYSMAHTHPRIKDGVLPLKPTQVSPVFFKYYNMVAAVK